METCTVYIQSLNQDWEMPRELAQNVTNLLNEQRKSTDGKLFYIDLDKEWYNNLSPNEKKMIKKTQR
jgi:hypothetical protein